MKWEFFIARRIYLDKDKKRQVSPPAVRLAIAGVALGLAVMIVTVAIVIGFKHEIRHKVVGFGSHVRISAFASNTSFETPPVQFSDSLRNVLLSYPDVARTEPYATKPGVFKTDSEYMGVVLKGVTQKYDWTFFGENLTCGTLPQLTDTAASNEILISQAIASKLQLAVGDDILSYFVEEERVRARKFTVTGIYRSDLTEFDKIYVIGDARHVQKLNNWAPDQYSGIELRLHHFDRMEAVTQALHHDLFATPDAYGTHYYVQSARELNATFFNWLDLLDMNVWIILILMAAVAGFTMISGLLIIILENTAMIGTLKAMGASNRSVRHIFLNVALHLVGRGLLWGNVIGIALCLVQKHFTILTLNPEAYYIPYVPIAFNAWYILLLNAASLITSMFMLLGPSYIVALIRPAKTIKFE